MKKFSFAALVMLTCVSDLVLAASGFQPVKDPAKRIELKGFSLLPPAGAGWQIHKEKESVIFAKNLGSDTHTAGISVVRHRDLKPELAGFAQYATDPQAFAAYVRGSIEYSNPPSGRMRIVELTVVPDNRFGYCARFQGKFEDHGSPIAPRVLLQQDSGYSCLSPTSPRDLVEITFSERGLPEERDPALVDVSEQFFQNLLLK